VRDRSGIDDDSDGKDSGIQPDSGLSRQAAVSGVMIITGFNSFGRLFWGGYQTASVESGPFWFYL
jgi:hypothetical protein